MTAASTLLLIVLAVLAVIYLVEKRWPNAVLELEENVLATLLALCVLISFIQVILRYGFQTSLQGALETTTVLFAWMILLGMSYGIKTSSHLGVDAVIRMFPEKIYRALAVFGAVCALLYGLMLFSSFWFEAFGIKARGGALEYWSKMHTINIGMEDMFYPSFLNESFGFPERVHRWVAYLALPFGLALFSFRSLQAIFEIIKGTRVTLIADHEAKELVNKNKDVLKGK